MFLSAGVRTSSFDTTSFDLPYLSKFLRLGGRRFYDDIPDLRRGVSHWFYRFGRRRICLCDLMSEDDKDDQHKN